MKHKLKTIYQEDYYSWKVVCECGWREGAHTEKEALARHDDHRKRPHK